MLSRIQLTFIALFLAGCNTAADVAEQRQKYLLNEEPAAVVSITDLVTPIPDTMDVALVGKIGGVSEPWTKGRAEFVIVDPVVLMEEEQHGDGCDCHFCQDEKGSTLLGRALVRFVDESGEVVAIDARRLFDVKESQMVVVRGKAKSDPLGNLTVAADGMYIRR